MGNVLSQTLIATLTASAIYIFYTNIYCSHKLVKASDVFDSCQKIPSFGYLLFRYFFEALRKRQGHLHSCNGKVRSEVAFTLLNCRLDTDVMRRFCGAAGYGWDYPDSEFRDIPLCYPEILCLRLLVMVISAETFRLSPLGLVRIRQSLKTLQPIDELKKGPFMLQARVLEYRVTEAGVEVDISLSAISRTHQPVWESVLTLISQEMGRRAFPQPQPEGYDSQLDSPEPDDVKTVDVSVPWTTGWKCAWAFSDYSPQRLLTFPAKALGYRCSTTSSLWMLSKCLAEVEKHKGVDAIRAPISVSAQFKEPLLVPGKVTIKFWETTPANSSRGLSFQMEQHRTGIPHIMGTICRTSTEDAN